MQSESDRLLDQALEAYVAIEPRTGLENWVLAGVRAGKRSGFGRWIALATACLALVVSIVCWPPRAPQVDGPPRPVRLQAVVNSAAERATVRSVAAIKVRMRVPRLERFPEVGPLTEEEKLLLSLAQHPEQARSLVADRYDKPVSPIEIDELQFPALSVNE